MKARPQASPSMAKKLAAYAAIGGAGSLTFGATAAEADIFFTDFQGTASQGSPLDIDVDQDGTADFTFSLQVVGPNVYGTNSNWGAFAPASGAPGTNAFASVNPSPFGGGVAYGPNNLAFGATISSQPFFGGAAGPMQMAYTAYLTGSIFGAFGGVNFTNPSDGYIGLRFQTGGGATVFGWVYAEVTGDVTNGNFANATINVDGFAYALNQSIRAGQIPEPSSTTAIGLLALGAIGLAERRRRKKKASAEK